MNPIRTCAKAIILRNRQILSVKYADEGGEYYALPGGTQLHGETLPAALVREVHEETGVYVSIKGLRFILEYIGALGESAWRDAGVHQVEFLFECTLSEDQKTEMGSMPDHGQVAAIWLPIEDIHQYRFYPRRLIDYLAKPFPEVIEYWDQID